MAWTSKDKEISLSSPTPHPLSRNGVTGRAPGVTTIKFTPAELFGAGARCSHLHIVDPTLVTPESLMVEKLLEQYVDNTSSDFAVLALADNFKDYVKSYFAGTVAAAVAYLAMIRDGYVWSDHFENLGGGDPNIKRKPDFVFAKANNATVALIESKGTRSEKQGPFDKTVEDGYTGQVEPHLGYAVGGATASHGFCIGSWLTSTTKAELNVHHTDVATSAPSAASGVGTPPAAVQQHDYATALRLAHSETLSRQVRQGQLDRSPIPFIEYDWIGWKFLSSCEFESISRQSPDKYKELTQLRDPIRQCCLRDADAPVKGFGVERNTAVAVLRAISRRGTAGELSFELEPLPAGFLAEARIATDGAVFPDGLAVFGRYKLPGNGRLVVWDHAHGNFLPA